MPTQLCKQGKDTDPAPLRSSHTANRIFCMSKISIATAHLNERIRFHLPDDDDDDESCIGNLMISVSKDVSEAPTSPTTSTRADSPSSIETISRSNSLSQENEALQIVSRYGDLERKRQELVQKRVSLEGKLFASTTESIHHVSGFDRRSSGRGKYCWSDGKTVTGQWADGQLNGRCFFEWPSGETYDGDVKNGKKHGRGVHTWADGKIYKGQYENGFEHGFGTLTQADGVCRYRGSFMNGKRHGTGTQVWHERTYEGEWKDNAVCGRGRLWWTSSGSRYEGEFLQGKYHGQGVFVNKSGHKYVGSWVHGRKEGFGKETWPQNEQSYVGAYQNGHRHGFGRLEQADGSYYVGGWCNNERSGYGIQVGSQGDVVECGIWRKDFPVRRRRLGRAQAINVNEESLWSLSVVDSDNEAQRQVKVVCDDLELCKRLHIHKQQQRSLSRRNSHNNCGL